MERFVNTGAGIIQKRETSSRESDGNGQEGRGSDFLFTSGFAVTGEEDRVGVFFADTGSAFNRRW